MTQRTLDRFEGWESIRQTFAHRTASGTLEGFYFCRSRRQSLVRGIRALWNGYRIGGNR